jgi:hypothetical protein
MMVAEPVKWEYALNNIIIPMNTLTMGFNL